MERPAAGLGQRVFAWAMARNHRYERFAAGLKQRLFAGLEGTVVELGPGTGANLRYLDCERGEEGIPQGLKPLFFVARIEGQG